MYFTIRYNQGYEVCVVMVNDMGYNYTHPLRNFGQRQGDAEIYKEHDCPRLTHQQIQLLIKNYNPARKYKRVNEHCFRVTDTE